MALSKTVLCFQVVGGGGVDSDAGLEAAPVPQVRTEAVKREYQDLRRAKEQTIPKTHPADRKWMPSVSRATNFSIIIPTPSGCP